MKYSKWELVVLYLVLFRIEKDSTQTQLLPLNPIKILTMRFHLKKRSLEEAKLMPMTRSLMLTLQPGAGLIFPKVTQLQQGHQTQMVGASLPSWVHMNVF